MATANSIKTSTDSPTSDPQSAMLEQITTIRQAIKAGATGYLFAACMPDGQLQWIAAGDLDDYSMDTSRVAMRLHQEALRFAVLCS